jgi:hypothetical protein
MKGKIILVAAAVAGTITVAAPASADDDPPSPGSPCSGSQLNETATTSDGATVRCLANEENGFSWLTDTGAAGTIAQLQSEGYTVTITRVGTGPLDQCKVTDVRNPTTVTRTNRTGTAAGNPGGLVTIVISKTIDVTLDCT